MPGGGVFAQSRAIVPAEDVGIDPYRLDVLLRRIRLEVEHGALPSVQVAVARAGRLVANETWGGGAPRYILQSVGRTIVASAIWKLIDDGKIDVSEYVADIIPEFGTNGKGVVTLAHMLTHTAGLAFAPLGYPKMADRDARMAAFAKWRLDSPPGEVLQYHLTSTAWVIAEVVERRAGLCLADYLHREIAEPLGLGFALGLSEEQQIATVAPMVCTDGDGSEVDPWGPWFFRDRRIVAAGEPAHAVCAGASDVALHYQALLHSSLWSRAVIAEATRPHVTAIPAGDKLYGGGVKPASVGLFVNVRGDNPDGWMPATGSPETFGHAGSAYQIGFCDPVSGISFCVLSNGYPQTGYDLTPRGAAMLINWSNLAADLI
ncbi:serine hydrolase domain-containing protein [Nocardia coffeae]|uniref:serine hydrolase domain-containing protein n=1 Tax=Nocardia coffeae TaxID=2873381 RepID=UPI0027E201F3|nr:serine hydrolase domain-containing protein [Nocardia coffeae]